MRLKKITLNNFRCFEHLELLLHPRLTVLIGENGAGKTNLRFKASKSFIAVG